MDIEPATLAQFLEGADGRMYEIPADVGGVVGDLRAIDPRLRVRYAERGRHYVVYQRIENPDGSITDHLVLTAQELDQRVVRRVQEIARPDYDWAADAQRVHERGVREREGRIRKRIESEGDRAAFAARKQFGLDKARIFVP